MSALLDEIYDKMEDAQHYGHYLSAVCIFHDDSRPSLMIYEDRYRCLSCGANGRTADLLKRLSSSFQPIAKVEKRDFSNPFSKWTVSKTLANSLQIAHLNLKNNPSIGHYLVGRGITIETQLKLGLGFRDDWFTFPIRGENKLITGAVARKNETNQHTAKYIIPFGQNPNLLYIPNWELIKNNNVLFLTFGILDAISIYMCGYASASTTTGKRIDSSVLDAFRKRIVLFPDKGEEFEALEISGDLGWRGKVFKCDWTMDAKDPNDLFVKYRDDFKNMLKGIVKNT